MNRSTSPRPIIGVPTQTLQSLGGVSAEIPLGKWALADGKPVLGVCRGMQLINVVAGGTLYQDLASQFPGGVKHDYFPFGGQTYTRDYLAHDVRIADDSRLARLFGAGAI